MRKLRPATVLTAPSSGYYARAPMTQSALPRQTWPWALIGTAGSVLVAYAAPHALSDPVVRWWYVPPAPAGRGVSVALVYAGMALLCVAWLALGRALPAPRQLLVIAGMWALPLALAPPLFSRDLYSYLAQGTILHLGHNPYHVAPVVLSRLGRGHVLDAVSPFWRHTTAPYGPLFLSLLSLVVGVAGLNLVAGVLLTRLVELVGVVLLAVSVPRLARALGADPGRALWLALLSPLVMLQLIAAGHNDVLMVGMLAAGVACALSGRPLVGVAICALAATVKVPALAGVVFITVAWARAEPDRSRQARFVMTAGLITVGVLGAVTLIAGVGVSWISTSLFSTPAKVHLAITPATGIGYTLSSLLRDFGIHTSARTVENVVGLVAFAATAAAGLLLVYRVRVRTLVLSLGVFLLIAAAGGPAAWPWYFIWGLALITALPGPQHSTGLAVALALSAFLVKPNGILALPLQSAPAVVLVYLVIAGSAWRRWRRRDGGRDGRRDGGRDGRRDGGRDGRRDGGRDGRRDGGRDGRRDGGRDGGRDGRRDGGRDWAAEMAGETAGEAMMAGRSPTMACASPAGPRCIRARPRRWPGPDRI
jgi:alpha-1,6-mannosyltransferase